MIQTSSSVEEMQSCNKGSHFLTWRWASSEAHLIIQAEKVRLQKQKEVVEEKSAPIQSVEEPIPPKTEDTTYVWKPSGAKFDWRN